jgi:hypothetical protein
MKPEFMRLRRALAGTVAALLLAAGLVVLSPAISASAHTPTVKADCTNGLSVVLKSYPSNTKVTVAINGTTVTDTSFQGHWSNTYTWDKNVDNTYRVVVKSTDDPYETKGWSFTKEATVKGCPDDKPVISITGSTCATPSTAPGTINFALSGVTKAYTVTLLGGPAPKTVQSSGGAGSFTGVSPGTYTVKASLGNSITTSGPVTVSACDTPPIVDLVAQPCVTGGSPGAVTATLSNLKSGAAYRIALLNSAGAELETLALTATGATFSKAFDGHGPGQYSVALYDSAGTLLVESASATILACTDEFKVTVELEPCATPQLGTDRAISVTVTGLAASTAYTVRLVTTATPAVEIDSTTIPSGTAVTFTHTFIGVPSPGDYKVEVLGGSVTLVSNTVSAGDCDLDTLAPPSIELLVVQCDGVSAAAGALSARMIDLDATSTYYVRLVDGSGDTVPGGEDQTVTGSTTATVQFPGVTAPGTYTAQLLIDPGKQLAATSPSSVDLGVCLPTLAMTGPGVLLPLGSVAALLLTLGGAVVMGRLRRRMAL